MKFILDLEIHSKYSRAVSPQMTLENLALWAVKKGINVLGTGDFTHPLWFKEIKEKLIEKEEGLYVLKKEYQSNKEGLNLEKMRFLLSSEINCVYSKGGKVRKVHHLIYAPNIAIAEKINTQLSWIGNLKSDGRPTLGLDSKVLLDILLKTSPYCVLIPAHCWTPWFGIFGSKSGFNSLKECFEELESEVFAIETGLSSDPPMNWRIPFLDKKAIISSSDSHSLRRIGREAIVFEVKSEDLNYRRIFEIIKKQSQEFWGTIEFFPEEGKYHYDGHLNCNLSFSPLETKKINGICPKCQKPLTIGVMSRIEELAAKDRPEGFKPDWAKNFYSLIPLDEIIAESLNTSVNSKVVLEKYEEILKKIGPEIYVLTQAREELNKIDFIIKEGILRVREKKVYIKPGYDGNYGVIKIFSEEERKEINKQKTLF